MTTAIDPIVQVREDHRQVGDWLLDLAGAAEAGDLPRARDALGALDKLVGPHMRYEEEVLYPAMREFLGEYVDKMQAEHDGVIATARTAADLLGKPSLTEEEKSAVVKAARALFVHIVNCDGLNILAERLGKERVSQLGEHLAASRSAGVGLLEYADTIRGRR